MRSSARMLQCVHKYPSRGTFRYTRTFATRSSGDSRVASGGPVTWRALAIFLGVGTGALGYYALEKERRMRGTAGYRKYCSVHKMQNKGALYGKLTAC